MDSAENDSRHAFHRQRCRQQGVTSLLLLKHGDSRREGCHSEDSRFEHCSRCRMKYRNIEQSTTGGPNSNRARAERIIFKNSEGPRVTCSTKKVNTSRMKLRTAHTFDDKTERSAHLQLYLTVIQGEHKVFP